MKLFVMQFFHYPVTSSLLGPNILFSTVFSNTPRVCVEEISVNISKKIFV
jgi:hypothetical protein